MSFEISAYQVEERSVGSDGTDARREQDHAQALEAQYGKVEIGRPVVARFAFHFDLRSQKKKEKRNTNLIDIQLHI